MIRILPLLCLLFLFAPALARAQDTPQDTPPGISKAEQESFDQWVAQFVARAAKAGRDKARAEALFKGMEPDPAVLDRDRDQPEFVRPIWQYLDSAVSDARVKGGRAAMVQEQGVLQGLELKTGIPRQIIVAVWGLESAYGKIQGNFDVVRSLATLAWDGRRRNWAEGELLAVMTMLDNGVPRNKLKGAWAGAMGQTQFIPSTFLAYAVDGDNDGQIDIWNSSADALASTANYLFKHGWKAKQPWGEEARLKKDFPYALAEDTVLSLGSWETRGASPMHAPEWPQLRKGEAARLLLPAGAQGPAILVGHNFRVIKRYNNSNAYALGVGLLARAIMGQSGLVAAWPRDALPLKRSEVKEMQQLLKNLGHDPAGLDGMAGPNTRRALRAWQAQAGLLPDGFVDQQALVNLRASWAAKQKNLKAPAHPPAAETPAPTQ